MSVEVELKFPLADPEALRAQLAELGARPRHDETFEDNEIWDRDGDLAGRGCLLRLRTTGGELRLTFKGPAELDDGVKRRVEHETVVGDGEALRRLLAALGYAPVRRYQKFRESWSLDGCEVVIDRTPMGTFTEFEGERAVELAERCRFDRRAALGGSYLDLWEEHRRATPAAPADMVFEPASSDG